MSTLNPFCGRGTASAIARSMTGMSASRVSGVPGNSASAANHFSMRLVRALSDDFYVFRVNSQVLSEAFNILRASVGYQHHSGFRPPAAQSFIDQISEDDL